MKPTEYAGYYVTEDGRVISIKSGEPRELTPRPDNWGYLQVGLWVDGKYKTVKVHRLVAKSFLGAKPGMQVNHKDGNKLNNHINNLEYVTPSENLKHAYDMGLRKKGDEVANAKLTDEQWIEIAQRYNNGEQARALAKEYGIHENAIYNVMNGKKRKWMMEQGLIQKAQGVGKTKIPAEKVAQAIKEMLNGAEPKDISERYNIPLNRVYEIRKGKARKDAWALVEGSETIRKE